MTVKIQGPFMPVPVWAFDEITKRGTSTHLHTLLAILRLTPYNGDAKMTHPQIAEAAGLSLATVKRAVWWLEDRGIITSERLAGNRGKKIMVAYKRPKGRVSGDPTPHQGRVAGDPRVGSLETPPRRPEQGERMYRDSTRDTRQREMSNDISLCGLRPEKQRGENMPILGADPDDNQDWDETPRLAKAAKNVTEVSDYFDFKARSVGGTPTSVRDRPIFRSHLKRIMSVGMTVADMKVMIDKFFVMSRRKESPEPWKAFCTTEVQAELSVHASSDLGLTSELAWVANEFDYHEGLPWDEDRNHTIRLLIWRRAMDLAHTYPELLVSIVLLSETNEDLGAAFFAANTLLREPGNASALEVLEARGVNIPHDLLKRGTLRKSAPSLRQSVVNYQATLRRTK